MFEAKITIEAPGLEAAINSLAAAISGNSFPAMSAPAAQVQTPTSAPATNLPGAAPVTTAAPVNYPAPSVPVASAPKYTVDQIMAAGATLMDAGKVNDLMNLLHSFGVQAVMDLKPEQLGAFATAMRDLGAQI